jgi:uncharacterized repeat protein (TIGR03803 family)
MGVLWCVASRPKGVAMRILTKSTRLFGIFICTTTVAVATSSVARAQVPFEVVHGFSHDRSTFPSALVQAADGDFYGTTSEGGALGAGTAFKVTRSGAVTILHDFDGSGPDGGYPASALILANDGNFYGTTPYGGRVGEGAVFRMTPTGVVTVLHSFLCASEGCQPQAPLIQAADGNLYGTTSFGGPLVYYGGSVFKIAPDGTFAVLHVFAGGDGDAPLTALLQAADGNFYGTTAGGGAQSGGTIFKMAPNGSITILHAIADSEGARFSALVQGADGNFYGTILYTQAGVGAVFTMTPAGSLTILHRFTGTSGDGASPEGALLRAGDGNLYGTTHSGGDGPYYSGRGTIFRVTAGGTVSTVYAFADGFDGHPASALTQGSDGNLYGTTQDHGSVFRMTTAGVFTTVANVFPGVHASTPEAALIQGTDGSLYGTTAEGGPTYAGTVFRLTAGGVTTTLHTFTGADGAASRAALLQTPDGNFYGTTSLGGSSNLGTIFRMGPDGTLIVLHAFTGGSDGAQPYGALARGTDGNLYGTTRDGGVLNFGTVFRVAPNGTYAVLYPFAGGYDGGHPVAGLVLGTDGNLYGTTPITGAFNAGTAFRITPQGGLTILHAFTGTDGTGRDGSYPRASLLQARDGNFYGTTYEGGTFGTGTIFRMTPGGTVTVIHSFTGSDGKNPVAALIQGGDGNFYGTASDGGGAFYAGGTAFRSTPTGTVTVIQSFYGENPYFCPYAGFYPHAALLQAHDGHMYGTTSQGGCDDGGTVFRLRFGPDIPNARVTSTADHRVQLRWPVSANATSYTVKRALASGQELVLATGLTAPSFVDSSATKGQRYYYVVSAINGFGEAASYEVSITPGKAIEGDFDGDRKADITVFRPSTGAWYMLLSSTGLTGGASYAWGAPGDVPVPGDYDGDGKTDLAVYRPSTGVWYMLLSSTGFTVGAGYSYGVAGDVPMPGDYDGDGKTDLAVYRPSTGMWYMLLSSTSLTVGAGYSFGVAGDVPVPGDYDGDGKTDLAIFRASTGMWYILLSSTGFTRAAGFKCGRIGDVPLPGDFDGDGKTDIAVYQPSTGIWYILLSSTGFTQLAGYTYGVADDVPVPGDYDGDGMTDLAVYRPATGMWYILLSSTGFTQQAGVAWGATGDNPVLKPR